MATYLLVHGGFVGGWFWKRVLPFLKDAGHEVFSPTLTGLGERAHLLSPAVNLDTHVQDVVGVINYEELQEVVLVGHSSSGMVIAGVADAVPERLSQVVYFDAVVPRDGEAMLDLFDPAFASMLRDGAQNLGDGWRVPPLPLESLGVTAEEDVRWAQPKMGWHPYRTASEPIRLLNGAGRGAVPHSFVYCNGPAMGLFELSAARARDEGWNYLELAAPHGALVTHPRQTAELLLDLGRG